MARAIITLDGKVLQAMDTQRRLVNENYGPRRSPVMSTAEEVAAECSLAHERDIRSLMTRRERGLDPEEAQARRLAEARFNAMYPTRFASKKA